MSVTSGMAQESPVAALPVRDLEEHMVIANQLAAACRHDQEFDEAALHAEWVDVLLDEWARRAGVAR